jgi:hypothetical protein
MRKEMLNGRRDKLGKGEKRNGQEEEKRNREMLGKVSGSKKKEWVDSEAKE